MFPPRCWGWAGAAWLVLPVVAVCACGGSGASDAAVDAVAIDGAALDAADLDAADVDAGTDAGPVPHGECRAPGPVGTPCTDWEQCELRVCRDGVCGLPAAMGERCDFDAFECDVGLSCFADPACVGVDCDHFGACMPTPTEGESCVGYGLGGLECVEPAHCLEGVCVGPAEAGEPCGPPDCREPLLCLGEPATCRETLPGLGEPCPRLYTCAEGLVCVDLADPRCTDVLPSAGEPCTLEPYLEHTTVPRCAAGLYCVGSREPVCQETPGGEGETCVPSVPSCADGLACLHVNDGPDVCERVRSISESCRTAPWYDVNGICGDDGYCWCSMRPCSDEAPPTCRPFRREGEACGGDVSDPVLCFRNLQCIDGVCVEPAEEGDPCFSWCAEPLVCIPPE